MNDLARETSAVTEATSIGLYLIYAFVAVVLVAFLARTLSRNGQIFLEETFDRPELAGAVNQLLVIGFYLLNLGYALLVYQLQPRYSSLVEALNELVAKLALLLLSLGVVHLVNMWVFWRIRSAGVKARRWSELPPPPPYGPARWSPGVGSTVSADG